MIMPSFIYQSTSPNGGWMHTMAFDEPTMSGFVSLNKDDDGRILWVGANFRMGDVSVSPDFDTVNEAAQWVQIQFELALAGEVLETWWK